MVATGGHIYGWEIFEKEAPASDDPKESGCYIVCLRLFTFAIDFSKFFVQHIVRTVRFFEKSSCILERTFRPQ